VLHRRIEGEREGGLVVEPVGEVDPDRNLAGRRGRSEAARYVLDVDQLEPAVSDQRVAAVTGRRVAAGPIVDVVEARLVVVSLDVARARGQRDERRHR